MTDYTELVNSLREHADLIKASGTEVYGPSATRLLVYDLRNTAAAIEELEAEVKRLEPKERKLGRWEKAKPKGVVTYSDGYAECSSCHEAIWLGWGMNFCPNCGVQNRIIDPMESGVKMEVQE